VPRYEYNGRILNNPVEFALMKVGGKWKMPILYRLNMRPWRFGELQRDLPGITHKMLTQHLRELEQDGFLTRHSYPEVPPRVEYSLTEKGGMVVPVIESLRALGSALMEAEGFDVADHRVDG
jgi:DNA-binding HxlR family transcriptional regulator